MVAPGMSGPGTARTRLRSTGGDAERPPVGGRGKRVCSIGVRRQAGHHWQVERNVTPTWYAAHGARGAPGRKRTHSISQAYWPTTPSVTPSQARSRQ